MAAVTEQEDAILRSVYYDSEHAASYGTADRLARATGIDLSRVQTWLSGEASYTLHRSVRHRFPRRSHLVYNIHDFYQADLIDMRAMAKENDGFQRSFSEYGRISFYRPAKGLVTNFKLF